jgi:hypothetical protein
MRQGHHQVVRLRSEVRPAAGWRGGSGQVHAAAVPDKVIAQVYGAPWRSIELVVLGRDGQVGPWRLVDSEVFVHVAKGVVEARFDDGQVSLVAGRSVTILAGDSCMFSNLGRIDSELFICEMGMARHA